MGVFPRRNPKTTYEMFTPLTRLLSKQLGIPVQLQTTKDFESFWKNVQNQEYDLVHFNQYHYIVANRHYGYQAVAMLEENNSSTIAGTITVLKESGITSVEQLRGRKVVFGGGKRAMLSHILPRWLLKKNGLDASEYFSSFARNPPNAIFSIYNGQADAAGFGDAVFKMPQVTSMLDTSKLHVLVKSDPIAQLPWAVSYQLGEELSDSIKSALTGIKQTPEGLEALKKAGITDIIPASHDDYLPSLEIIQEVFGESLGVDQP